MSENEPKDDTKADSGTELAGRLVMDFEQFAAINGASSLGIGDAGLHRRGNNDSDKRWHRLVLAQQKKDVALIDKRAALRLEYAKLVSEGTIRAPTRLESLLATANGHLDNESTKAAQRILKKMGFAANEQTLEQSNAAVNPRCHTASA